MKLGFDLTQIQTQKLALTSELIQTIKILQLNSLDLENYIEEELLSNPILEVNEAIVREYTYDALSHRMSTMEPYEEKDEDSYENHVAAEISLFDFLHFQLRLIRDIDDRTRKIAEYIIDTLDENGYRTERATEIAAKLGYTHDEVMNAIRIIQGLEPAGVSAKSLEECLLLQLKRQGEIDSTFENIVNNHLQDIAANRIAIIAKDCNIGIDEAQDYCDIIRALDPKPGSRYGKGENNRYIVPDCYLEVVAGKYIVSVNESDRTSLQVSPYYERLKLEAYGDQETLDYLNDRMNAALWLIKSIDRRKETIYNVAEAIVSYQHEFFEKGTRFLRPMTLSVIAEQLGIHESTVSRTVNGKFIQTPRGLFELKFFFGGGTVSTEGSEITSKIVKDYIKEIVAGEDVKHPYSDEKIKDLLKEKYNTELARRTVAKYRDQLGIPGGSKRKRY